MPEVLNEENQDEIKDNQDNQTAESDAVDNQDDEITDEQAEDANERAHADDGGEEEEKVETYKKIVSQEDLDTNPELVEAGIKVGDEIELPVAKDEDAPIEEKEDEDPKDEEPKFTEKELSTEEVLDRNGYKLYFVHRDNESLLNELRNSGKSMGELNITSATDNQDTDEIVIAIKD